MADDLQNDDVQEEAAPKKKRRKSEGMSTLTKVLLGLGCGGVLGLLICCGGFAYFGSQMVKVSEDPVKIAAMRDEIVGITVPDDLPPKMGMDMNFVAFKMKMIMHGEEQGKFLMLMAMDFPDANQQQLDQQLKMQGNQQMQQQGKNVNITESETRKLMVDGEEREYVFAKGTMNQGGQQIDVRQVTGTFSARKGVGMLILISPEDQWNEEETIQMIESIKK